MTTPHPPTRRSRPGWPILLAVAGLVLGGGIAVRLTRRRPTNSPAPAPIPVLPPRPAGTSAADPSRQLTRMAIGGAIAVVLAITIAVATRPAHRGGTHSLTLTGSNGARAEIELQDHDGAPGRPAVVYAIQIRNTGTSAVDTGLGNAWVLDTRGTKYPADDLPAALVSIIGARGLAGPAWQPDANGYLSPGEQTVKRFYFTVPRDARLTRLHITVVLDSEVVHADWDL
ncbi:hypothetical protein GCM10010168_23770 [Actinoplanes ianthinogenes]|uniref:DUF4352 domain-containing protein n=1 Tax=Actinoplanes ianthinogenes TaxID=122358 RepID=A0ABN6CS06_9ACTN|nr:hypothetical protein [Actinoplanes ianthinogenes]BCJ48018.1 hypothetical protein Aiant_86750 [Actinoplanes ianthinogenes]GGR05801.1 hypothetical protein GCM10010168_23770 [Actinoplanes ianthinogenes]